MSVQNEVVKFIAEIDLDAQDKANFLQGLKECDKECSDLRDGILHLQNSLTKLRTEGKEDTKEFRRHRCNSFYFYIKPQLLSWTQQGYDNIYFYTTFRCYNILVYNIYIAAGFQFKISPSNVPT